MRITAVYPVDGRDTDVEDAKVHTIFKRYLGEHKDSDQTMIDPRERDIEFEVPDMLAHMCTADLVSAGFRVVCS